MKTKNAKKAVKTTIKTGWDLGLLYKGSKDPNIEKDLLEIEKACSNFEKKYKGQDFTATPEKLLKVLKDFELVKEKMDASKPWWYFTLKTMLDSEDSASQALSTKFQQRLTQSTNKIRFFTLDIAKINKEKQVEFLKSSKFQDHNYFLFRIFKRAEFNLPEGEEQILNLLSQTSYDMWDEVGQKSVSKQMVSFKGKSIPIAKATSMIPDLPKGDRRLMRSKINDILKSISNVAEAEINAIYNYKKVVDERRGYKKPYSSTVLGYENDEESVELLISLVTKYFSISQRFYKQYQ